MSLGQTGLRRETEKVNLLNVYVPFSLAIQEGVEINDALGFSGFKKSVPGSVGRVAGNESLDPKDSTVPLSTCGQNPGKLLLLLPY